MLTRVLLALTDVRLNPFVGAYAWLLHRISGIVLVVYLFLHLWTLGAALDGPEALDARLAIFRQTQFAAFEVLVLVAAAFHLLNGVRLVAVELWSFSRVQRTLFFVVLAGTLVVAAGGAWALLERAAA